MGSQGSMERAPGSVGIHPAGPGSARRLRDTKEEAFGVQIAWPSPWQVLVSIALRAQAFCLIRTHLGSSSRLSPDLWCPPISILSPLP
jgi:hypothetical protein